MTISRLDSEKMIHSYAELPNEVLLDITRQFLDPAGRDNAACRRVCKAFRTAAQNKGSFFHYPRLPSPVRMSIFAFLDLSTLIDIVFYGRDRKFFKMPEHNPDPTFAKTVVVHRKLAKVAVAAYKPVTESIKQIGYTDLHESAMELDAFYSIKFLRKAFPFLKNVDKFPFQAAFDLLRNVEKLDYCCHNAIAFRQVFQSQNIAQLKSLSIRPQYRDALYQRLMYSAQRGGGGAGFTHSGMEEHRNTFEVCALPRDLFQLIPHAHSLEHVFIEFQTVNNSDITFLTSLLVLKTLVIRECPELTDDIQMTLEKMPSLTALTVDQGSHVPGLLFPYEYRLTHGCFLPILPRLRSLDVSYAVASSDALRQIGDASPPLEHLTLRASACTAQALTFAVSRCHSLATLTLCACGAEMKDEAFLTQLLASRPGLTIRTSDRADSESHFKIFQGT